MRIAQVAPLAEAVPPPLYGGTERIVSHLTGELVALGQEVTLFASGDSRTAARLEAAVPRALRLGGPAHDPSAPHVLTLARLLERLRDFDAVHFQLDHLHPPLVRAAGGATPSLTTQHGRLDLPALAPLFRAFPEAPLVSISHAQRRPLPHRHGAGARARRGAQRLLRQRHLPPDHSGPLPRRWSCTPPGVPRTETRPWGRSAICCTGWRRAGERRIPVRSVSAA